MAQDTLAGRVSRYLRRHIDHLEETLVALESVDFSQEGVLVDFERRAESAAQLDSEQGALLTEWQAATGITAEERAAVRALAGRASALSGRLREAYEAAEQRIAATSATVLIQANEVRRGADAARRFGGGAPDIGGFIDHSA